MIHSTKRFIATLALAIVFMFLGFDVIDKAKSKKGKAIGIIIIILVVFFLAWLIGPD